MSTHPTMQGPNSGTAGFLALQRALAECRATLHSVVDRSPDGLLVLSADHHILFANEAAEGMFGEGRELLVGRPFGLPLGNNEPVMVELLRHDGEAGVGELRWVPTVWEGSPATLVSIRDLTTLERSRTELRRANRALTLLGACLQARVEAEDGQGFMHAVCRIAVEVGGYEAASIALRARPGTAREVIHVSRTGAPANGSAQLEDQLLTAAIASGQTRTHRPRASDDACQETSACIALPFGPAADPSGAICVRAGQNTSFDLDEIGLLRDLARDLGVGLAALHERAARQAADRRIREMSARTTAIQDHLPGALLVWQHQPAGFVLVEWNRAAQALLADIAPDGLGSSCERLEFAFPGIGEDLAHCVERGAPLRRELSCVLAESEATRRLVANYGHVPGGLVVMHVVDVTEHHLAELQLRQAQRLEAIGMLAGGVAHDFNNLLSVILTVADLIEDDHGEAPGLGEDLADIREAAHRARTLTAQLLAFGQKQVLEPVVCDLNTTLQGMLKMLGRLIPEHIELRLGLSPQACTVLVDPDQIIQIVLNLAVNARDAMPEGGVLTLETALITVGLDGTPPPPGLAPGTWVRLRVSDTGHGMDEAVRSRVFDPFFSTKTQGRGTGLGLATVYGIVQQSGGAIDVESAPGRGARFEILLPLVEAGEPGAQPEHPGRHTTLPRGQVERVLIVEDERAILRALGRGLEAMGYQVMLAGDGEEARRLLEHCEHTVDYLVTDVVLPGLNGREVAELVRARFPRLRVLYMSGYTSSPAVLDAIAREGSPFLQKPVTASIVAAALRRSG